MVKAPEKWDLEVDVVAVGSSSGGMTAAIYAHDAGLKAVVLEKADSIGGGCGVLIWIPINHYMREAGITDSREAAIDYLRHTAVGRGEEGKMEAYVAYGAEAVDYVEQRTPLKFAMTMGAGGADYRAELPGGMMEGRHLGPDPLVMAQRLVEGAKRFPELNKVRQSPHGELGGLPEQMWAGSKAYYGGLALGCMERGIYILLETPGRELVMQDGRVVGIRAVKAGRDFFVRASRGVVLATGGFEWNDEMNRRFIHGPELKAITKPANAGDGHIMGMEVGAAVALMDHSVWLPAVCLPGDMSDGQQLYRLFLTSCGKPGDILVNKKGQRFCDESFFPDIGRGWVTYDSHEQVFPNAPSYHICDQAYRDKYMVGTAGPGTEAPSWMAKGNTLRELAQKLDIDADGLEQTVARFNRNAREGKDPDFQRGEYKYERATGAGGPKAANPCIGPIEKPPFYGVEALPATAGHQGGLVTNEDAQVMSVRGQAIPGLYACSNTAAHLTCGFSYNSGLNLGQSLVFGYLAAKHMVSPNRGA